MSDEITHVFRPIVVSMNPIAPQYAYECTRCGAYYRELGRYSTTPCRVATK